MLRGFFLLSLNMAVVLAAPDSRDRVLSTRPRLCEMDPNTCQCFIYNSFSACNYNLADCTCQRIDILRDVKVKQTLRPSPNITSPSRLLTSTCHVDFSTCLCGFEPITVPDLDVSVPRPACFTHSSTCQCGWDTGAGGYAQFQPLKPIIYSIDTCVTDYSTCTCMAGTIVTPPQQPVTLVQKLDSIKSQLLELADVLLAMVPPAQRLVSEPLGALKALSVDQRTKVISEAVSTMMQLRSLVEDAQANGRLGQAESDILLARLSGDVEYLTALSRDPNLLAAEIGEIEGPIVMRLRKMVAAFEEALKRDVKVETDV